MSRIDELRKQYPHVSPDFFDGLEREAKIQARLDSLRGQLAWLAGYYSRRGAVPVVELQKVLNGEKVADL